MDRERRRARSLRKRPTDAEAKLWFWLRAGRFRASKFRRQHPIEGYVVDLVCLRARLIVEVDGATHSTDHQREQDEIRSKRLRELGFQIICVSNLDVFDNIAGVLDRIAAELGPLASPPPEGEVDGEAGGRGFTDYPERP